MSFGGFGFSGAPAQAGGVAQGPDLEVIQTEVQFRRTYDCFVPLRY